MPLVLVSMHMPSDLLFSRINMDDPVPQNCLSTLLLHASLQV